MFLDEKTVLEIWLNPGLNLTIFRGTGTRWSTEALKTYEQSFFHGAQQTYGWEWSKIGLDQITSKALAAALKIKLKTFYHF